MFIVIVYYCYCCTEFADYGEKRRRLRSCTSTSELLNQFLNVDSTNRQATCSERSGNICAENKTHRCESEATDLPHVTSMTLRPKTAQPAMTATFTRNETMSQPNTDSTSILPKHPPNLLPITDGYRQSAFDCDGLGAALTLPEIPRLDAAPENVYSAARRTCASNAQRGMVAPSVAQLPGVTSSEEIYVSASRAMGQVSYDNLYCSSANNPQTLTLASGVNERQEKDIFRGSKDYCWKSALESSVQGLASQQNHQLLNAGQGDEYNRVNLRQCSNQNSYYCHPGNQGDNPKPKESSIIGLSGSVFSHNSNFISQDKQQLNCNYGNTQQQQQHINFQRLWGQLQTQHCPVDIQGVHSNGDQNEQQSTNHQAQNVVPPVRKSFRALSTAHPILAPVEPEFTLTCSRRPVIATDLGFGRPYNKNSTINSRIGIAQPYRRNAANCSLFPNGN